MGNWCTRIGWGEVAEAKGADLSGGKCSQLRTSLRNWSLTLLHTSHVRELETPSENVTYQDTKSFFLACFLVLLFTSKLIPLP